MALKDGTASKSIARTSSGGQNVPSEIVLEILSNLLSFSCYPARILLEIESNPIHPMLTSLLDLVKNKATAAAGSLILLSC